MGIKSSKAPCGYCGMREICFEQITRGNPDYGVNCEQWKSYSRRSRIAVAGFVPATILENEKNFREMKK